MPITSQEEYDHIRAQLERQTIERDALNVTIADIGNACAVWEAEHQPAEPDTQA